MTSLVLDTHSLIWFLNRSSRLSPLAAEAIHAARAARNPLFVSSVSIVEVIYLTEKRSLEARQLSSLLEALRHPHADIVVQPFDLGMAEALARIPRAVVPDMPDRMIAATALHLNLPLVTADAQIRNANIETIW